MVTLSNVKLSLICLTCLGYMALWFGLLYYQYPCTMWIVNNPHLILTTAWTNFVATILLVVPGVFPMFFISFSYFLASVGKLLTAGSLERAL
jgi:hypothetical protein